MVKVEFTNSGVKYDTNAFFQYDYGIQLEIHGLSIPDGTQFHFANKCATAYKVLSSTANGVTTVLVPQKVLEVSGEMMVYIYPTSVSSGVTLKSISFNVRRREKPGNYAPPDEPGIVEQLQSKLDKIIATGIAEYEPDQSVVEQIASDYVRENFITNNDGATIPGTAWDAVRGKVVRDEVNVIKNTIEDYGAVKMQLATKAPQVGLNTTNINVANLQSVKADITYVDYKTQANNLSYKESYATLIALQTAYPSGDIYNHAVLVDSIYYIHTWANSAWTNTQIQANGTGIVNGSVIIEKLDKKLRNDLTMIKIITSRNLIDSGTYANALVSAYFYDADHKTATFALDDVIELNTTSYYQTDIFFSDGTKASNIVSVDYLQDSTIIATKNNATRIQITTNANLVNKVRFSFGADARTNYSSKSITGFALYINPTVVDTLTQFDTFTYKFEITDIENLKADTEGLKEATLLNNRSIQSFKTTFSTVLNLIELATIFDSKTLNSGGLVNQSDCSVIEIPVTALSKYYIGQFHTDGGRSGLYDDSMNYLGNFFTIAGFGFNQQIIFPSGCTKIRFALLDTYSPSMFFGYFNDYINYTKGYRNKLINTKKSELENVIDVFLPNTIYCAVGRTIELYNNQVCLQADKYNLRWNCTIGKPMKRKFVIQGLQALIGSYELTLEIVDDDLNILAAKLANINIVDALISNSYKCVTIGDSLTYDKWWLAEVQNLSNNKIQYVGKTAFSLALNGTTYTGHHDGRPGFTAANYLAATACSYTGETTHAFWDAINSRFNWSYYVTNTLGGVSPSFVQIFLGTNGIGLDPTTNANNIKQIVDYIRQDNANIPIFIVNTLFRSNQDGIGIQGSNQGYASIPGQYKYLEDKKIFNLMVKINDLLSAYTNLFFVPVAIANDSEYNYGLVETPVNPRATQTELLPVESIHTQQQGDLQSADIMFSTFCGVLT